MWSAEELEEFKTKRHKNPTQKERKKKQTIKEKQNPLKKETEKKVENYQPQNQKSMKWIFFQ